jgi:hypothetical protein
MTTNTTTITIGGVRADPRARPVGRCRLDVAAGGVVEAARERERHSLPAPATSSRMVPPHSCTVRIDTNRLLLDL